MMGELFVVRMLSYLSHPMNIHAVRQTDRNYVSKTEAATQQITALDFYSVELRKSQ